MAQGKKYNDDIKEKAFALLACNNSVADVARALNLPYTTVQTWQGKYLAQSEKLAQQEENGAPNNEQDLVKLRQQKKEEFINDAWSLVSKTKTLIERRLDRAIESEDVIDQLLDEILQLDKEDLSDQQRRSLHTKIAAIKIENVRELAVVLGTLYDKQALANKEPTAVVDCNISIRFEDL